MCPQVKINKIRDSSPLAEDLCMLRKSYAYGYVEMELTFTMDLYPFYPPLVKLVSKLVFDELLGCLVRGNHEMVIVREGLV